ncbi:unnamed protein product, partial [Discosporangium mesarthrocarpum]
CFSFHCTIGSRTRGWLIPTHSFDSLLNVSYLCGKGLARALFICEWLPVHLVLFNVKAVLEIGKKYNYCVLYSCCNRMLADKRGGAEDCKCKHVLLNNSS